jgi:glycosyltransferase involved in cell wall biosynthesis
MSDVFASIVIPVHNEQESLPILMQELMQVLGAVAHSFEVIFTNDCSTDGSAETLDRMAINFPFVRVMHLTQRGGQTGCYQVAFAEARGEYIIRMDSDLQDDPQDLRQFFACLDEGRDLVIGLRTIRKHRRLLRACSIFYDFLMVLLFDSPLYTNTSSFVAFRSRFVKGIAFKKNDHRYLPIIAMHRGAENLKEVIIASRERKFGESKYKNFRKVIRGLPEVIGFVVRMKTGYYDYVRVHQLPVITCRATNDQRPSRT